jgi:hypothetical protein
LSKKKRTIEEEGHNIILFLFFVFAMPFTMRFPRFRSNDISVMRTNKEKFAIDIVMLFCFVLSSRD